MQSSILFPRYIGAFVCSIALPSTALLAAEASSPQAVSGVANFHQVDDHVYRGGQPTDEGFRNLAKLGIKIVIDLREPGERSVPEEKTVTASGMKYIGIPMKGMQKPSDQSMRKALDLLENKTTGPVFVHCKRGADRTGDVIACYRVEHDGWKNAAALAEARSLGMSWFQKAIQHYVLGYHPRTQDAPSTVVAGDVAAPATAVVPAAIAVVPR